MRKIILLVVLLAALGGVSYLKSTRQSESEQDAFVKGKSEGVIQSEQDRRSADSLGQALEQYRSQMADSLLRRDSTQLAIADSLSQVIAQQGDSLDYFKQQIDSRPNSKRIVADAKAEDSTRLLKHQEILAYYTARFRKLPTDLTAYEQRVATAEIRTETAEKFAISVNELDTIRTEAKLDF